MSYAKRHVVMLSRTLRQVSDLSMLFCRPTAAHLAPFILPSLGWRSASRRSCVVFRQTAIGKKPDQAPGSRFRAGSLQSTCRIFGDRTCVTCRQIERSQDAGVAAAVLVLCRSGAGRRQADGSLLDVAMSGVVDSGRERGHGNIDANDPEGALDRRSAINDETNEILRSSISRRREYAR